MITGNYKITGMSSNNYNILEAKLNGNTIYTREEESPYYIEYTVDTTSAYALNGGNTSNKYGLPKIYSPTNTNGYFPTADMVEITLTTGGITNDLSTKCSNVAKVKIVYPEDTTAVKFYGNYSVSPKVKTIDYIKTDNFNDMSNMFYYCSSLTSLDLSNWDTAKVNSMSGMFQNCTSLTSVSLTERNTSSVTNMSYMFSNCSSLTSLDLSNFNTINVTDMNNMFSNCKSLTSLNLTGWNTSKVNSMSNMFYYCQELTSLNLSNFNTSNVLYMDYMFGYCISLTSLNLSNFNTSSVIKMNSMFQNCQELASLDLSNFNTINVTDMRNMFYNCTSLTALNISNFNTNNIILDEDYGVMNSYMFYNVPSDIIWYYDGSNYANCRQQFNSYKNSLGFSGIFPWMLSGTTTIDYTSGTTLPAYPNWFSRKDTSTTYFIPDYKNVNGSSYGLWSNMTSNNGVATAKFKITPSRDMILKVYVSVDSEAGCDKFAIYCSKTDTTYYNTASTIDRYFYGSGTLTAYSDPILLEAGEIYYLTYIYTKDSEEYMGSDGALIRSLTFYPQNTREVAQAAYSINWESSEPTFPSFFKKYTNGSYSFARESFTYSSVTYSGLVAGNRGIHNSTSWICYRIVAPFSGTLSVNLMNYAQSSYDYTTVYLTTTVTQPSNTTQGTGCIFYGKSNVGLSRRTASGSITSGTTYYLHFQYTKNASTSSYADAGIIFSVEISK